MRFLLDTSCIVAAVCSWHTHHEATAAEISRRLSRGEEPIMAAPALVEAYAVLTRLPAPHRLLPTDALALLEANFIARRHVVPLDGRGYTDMLRGAPELGIEGNLRSQPLPPERPCGEDFSAFLERVSGAGRQVPKRIVLAARPSDFHFVGFRSVSQTKGQRQFALRAVARAGVDGLPLLAACRT